MRRTSGRAGSPSVALSAVAVLGALAGAAAGQVNSSGVTGANHARAFNLFQLSGMGVNVGVIEPAEDPDLPFVPGGAGVRNANNIGGAVGAAGSRLRGQWNFVGLSPPVPIGVGGPPALGAGASHHSTLVANTIAGAPNGGFMGVARRANIYFAQTNNDASVRAGTDWLQRAHGVHLFNASFGNVANDNGANQRALFWDWFANQRDALIVKSAGNNGNQITVPGDFYNGMTVGATDTMFRARADFSSYRLAGDANGVLDVRGKPDILAPGGQISDNVSYPMGTRAGDPNLSASGTSFAAPHVTGTAALLMEAGLGLPGGGQRNHQAIKAIIMNSARKRGISGENRANAFALDNAGTAAQQSDYNYLNDAGDALRPGMTGDAGPRTAGWTPTEWTYNALTSRLTVDRPLDDEQGTGVLDTTRALIQHRGGEQEEGNVGTIGWNRDGVSSTITDSYFLNIPIIAGSFLTATLAWDRIVSEFEDMAMTMPGDGIVEGTDHYAISPLGLPNLDLKVFFRDMLIGQSISTTDNVEHLHFPLGFYGEPRDYRFEVSMNGGAGFGLVDYGVAWWVPAPSSLVLLGMGAGVAIRRRRS